MAALLIASGVAEAQDVEVSYVLGMTENLEETLVKTGEEEDLLKVESTWISVGSNLTPIGVLDKYETEEETIDYDVALTKFQPTAKAGTSVSTKNLVEIGMQVEAGHTFKAKKISFDASRIGSEKSKISCYLRAGSKVMKIDDAVVPQNSDVKPGYSHHEFRIADVSLGNGEQVKMQLYILSTDVEQSVGLRNLKIEGTIDEMDYQVKDVVKEIKAIVAGREVDFTAYMAELKDGESVDYDRKLKEQPTAFDVTTAEGFEAVVDYKDNVATLIVSKNGKEKFSAKIGLKFRTIVHGEKKPMNRGLVAIPTGSGNYVSWKARATDGVGTKYYLYRGKTLISGGPIMSSTNIQDANGSAQSTYRLVVVDREGNKIDEQSGVKPWKEGWLTIPIEKPEDERGLGATYTPNDAAIYDVDGDGEYEIIVKWEPDNAKDPSKGGVTSSTYIDCYKLDGKKLWRINLGKNIRSGAHYTQFLAYDFDGDGYGEIMMKTAPGTIDGLGCKVIMGDDAPEASYVNSSGKIQSGPEYLSVFDGTTGEEINTIKYHTTYDEGILSNGQWGGGEKVGKCNESDRYLACVAYLDGEHPSAVFARGYYHAAFVGAYDFDGEEITLRWLHKSTESGKGLWREGAHSVTVGDVDDDGRDEIVYGSAALDDDGSILYRTGLTHGDALHMSDFVPDRPGMEVYMVHEKVEENGYIGYDLRDAQTGELLATGKTDSDTGRGLIGNFDDKHEGAEFMATCSGDMFDCHGNVIAPWHVGSTLSSSINFRCFWDGDVYDDYFDRGHVDTWDSKSQSWGRLTTLWQVNGSSTINGTKENPNLQADMFGDWREELICYKTESDGSFSMVVNMSTTVTPILNPTLMDDHQYEMAIAWQNVCYNQPPHTSYCLEEAHNERSEPIAINEGADGGWAAVFAKGPVSVPEGVVVKTYSSMDQENQTVRLKDVTMDGDVIPAGTTFLAWMKKKTVFRSAMSEMKAAGSRLKAYHCDSVKTNETDVLYELKDGEQGVGFYKMEEGAKIEAQKPFLQLNESTAQHDFYRLEDIVEETTAAKGIVRERGEKGEKEENGDIYDMAGRKVVKKERGKMYIVDGKLRMAK